MKFLDRFKRKSSNPMAAAASSGSNDPADDQTLVDKTQTEDPDEFKLELGDFLHRIPPHLLNPGPHDLKTEIYFSIADLSERIARGETTVELVTLYKQAPQIFRTEVRATDNLQVRFPWQRLAALVKQTNPPETESTTTASNLRGEPKTEVAIGTSASVTIRPGNSEGVDERLQKALQERDAALKTIAQFQREIEVLRDASPLASITAERDALLQQKAHLSRQISDLSRRGPGSALLSTSAAAQQRQVEEFQRRIALMESAQRDTALELSREKEARAKAEKLLTAADKLQEQSANYMVNARAEIRREVESSIKVREIETRKIQKDLQDQLAAQGELYRKACLDLDEARALLSEFQQGGTPAPEPSLLENVEQLERELRVYREQVDTLIKERDGALEDARKSQADTKSKSEVEDTCAKLQAEVQRLMREHATLSAEMQATAGKYEAMFADFENDHTTVVRAKEDLAQRLADSERARRILEKEHTKAGSSDVGLLGDPALQAELSLAREQVAALEKELAAASAFADLTSDGLSPERAQMLAQRDQDDRAALRRELARIQAERDNLAYERDQLLLRAAENEPHHKGGITQHTQGELLPANVIDVTEILPPESEKGVRISHTRPATVRPPKIRNS